MRSKPYDTKDNG